MELTERMMVVLRTRWEFVGSYRHLLTRNRLFTWPVVWTLVIVSEFQSWLREQMSHTHEHRHGDISRQSRMVGILPPCHNESNLCPRNLVLSGRIGGYSGLRSYD